MLSYIKSQILLFVHFTFVKSIVFLHNFSLIYKITGREFLNNFYLND